MRNILKLCCIVFLFSCENDDFRNSESAENIVINTQAKVQIKEGNQVSEKAIRFIKTKTENNFTISLSKNSVSLSQKSFLEKSSELGIIDTSKEIVVFNETNTKHTFKVISPLEEENSIINIIIVEKEDSVYEYFLKYTFNGEIPMNVDGTAVDFSQFNGTIETFNSEGISIGELTIENGIVINNQGDLAPCTDEPTEPTNDDDDTSNDTSGGSDAGTGIPGGSDEELPYNNTSNGGEFVDPNSDCGLSWSYSDCGCGPQYANGHAPSGNSCCSGSAIVIRDCNGTIIMQRNSTDSTTMFKRTGIDPCDDGDVGVILDDDDCNTSKEDLQKIFPNMSDGDAKLLAKLINEKGTDFGIDTKEKLWHFLAQAGHETGGFTDLDVTESTYWTTASKLAKTYDNFTMDSLVAVNDSTMYFAPDYLQNSSGVANIAMSGRLGNGNVASGDGYKYRGRGILQLTGKYNYIQFKTWYNNKYDPDVDFITSPENISTNDTLAILSGMWYYKFRVLDKITVDSTVSVYKLTKYINSTRKGLKDRKKKFKIVKDSITCIE